jgi:hypothetical protein
MIEISRVNRNTHKSAKLQKYYKNTNVQNMLKNKILEKYSLFEQALVLSEIFLCLF